ncbi:MAG TPA: PEPxxWA-CTERM sorting domain-containing protein [Caulobacteraceae bacterium]|nr:PEPxxWA-CTERM sorting domain-containing protein [Caulobacteraceae bacterium]
MDAKKRVRAVLGSGAALAAGLGMLALASPASSTVWMFHDVSMSGGTDLEGTFTTDPSTGALETWDISIAGGPQNGYEFANTINPHVAIVAGPQQFTIGNDFTNYISFTFTQSLAGNFGPVDIASASFTCGACGDYFVSGDTGLAAVPEPASWAMMILGVGVTGATLRLARRRRRAAAG